MSPSRSPNFWRLRWIVSEILKSFKAKELTKQSEILFSRKLITPYLPKLVFQWETSLLKRLGDVMPVIFNPNSQINVFTVRNDITLPVPTCGTWERVRWELFNLITNRRCKIRTVCVFS